METELKIYEVASGRMGCSYERVYVVAGNREDALQIALERFQDYYGGDCESIEVSACMDIVEGICSTPDDEGLVDRRP